MYGEDPDVAYASGDGFTEMVAKKYGIPIAHLARPLELLRSICQ